MPSIEKNIYIFLGVGKSVITKVILNNLEESQLWAPINLIFSAQTSSGRTQEILELKLERRKRTVLGAPIGKRVCVFVDDVNMPKLDTYGSQPPIELLRYFSTSQTNADATFLTLNERANFSRIMSRSTDF